MFKYVKNQKSTKQNIKALRNAYGEITNEMTDIVELLNEQFKSVFVIEGDGELPVFESRKNECLIDIDESSIVFSDVVDMLTVLI